jgi:phage terminase large subunit-like protein
MTDIAEWRQIAEAATTTGPWTAFTGYVWSGEQDETDTIAEGVTDTDATHIATFDPPTVLALLNRLQAAEAKVTHLEAQPHP